MAREHGLKKLMYLKEAQEKCPEMVVVNGEDLTNYREMSYRVTGKDMLGRCHIVTGKDIPGRCHIVTGKDMLGRCHSDR